MFSIDWSKYRLIDLSKTVVPTDDGERPFIIERFTLADGAYGYRVKTHSHVGTHVEAPIHFYGSGKNITDYPPEYFMGHAVLLEADPGLVDDKKVEAEIGDIIKERDIIICRSRKPKNIEKPCLTVSGARWLADKNVTIVGIGVDFNFGTDIEEGRKIHDIFMSKGVVFIEFLENLDKLSKREFYFIAIPYKAVLDSSWVRAVAIEDR